MLESQGRKVGLASRREGSAICCHWFSVDRREPQNEPGLILCCPSRKFQNPGPPLSSVGTPLSVEAKMGHCRACSHDLKSDKDGTFCEPGKAVPLCPLHLSISELEMVFKRFWHFPEAREGAHLPPQEAGGLAGVQCACLGPEFSNFHFASAQIMRMAVLSENRILGGGCRRPAARRLCGTGDMALEAAGVQRNGLSPPSLSDSGDPTSPALHPFLCKSTEKEGTFRRTL